MDEPMRAIELEYQHSTPRTKVSGHALAALLIAVLTWFPLVSAGLAYWLARIGQRHIASGARRGRGLAIAAIVMAAINLVGAPLLAYLGVNAYVEAKANAQRVKLMTNLRSLGQLIMIYSAENRGYLPADLDLLPAIGARSPVTLLVSPSGNPAAPAMMLKAGPSDYVYAPPALRMNQIRQSAMTPLMYEPPANYGNAFAPVLFADGHVELVKPPRMQTVVATVDANRAAQASGQASGQAGGQTAGQPPGSGPATRPALFPTGEATPPGNAPSDDPSNVP